jgi:hypothetical protein
VPTATLLHVGYAALLAGRMIRHRDAEGAPLVEMARLGAVYLLDLGPGPTPASSPGVAAEIRVLVEGVVLVHWLFGERFRVVSPAEQI